MSVQSSTLIQGIGRAISEENLFNKSLYELNGKTSVDKDLISSARGLLQNSGQTPLPTVLQLSSEELNNHWAAFSSDTNTIYVAPDLNSFPELENAVLVHELGHWLANQLGLQSTHASVRNFTNTLVGELQESSQNLGNTDDADLSSNQTITLPDGRIIKVQYFDTVMHTDWDKQLFPLLSQKASTTITNAQNHTDAFTTWDPLYTQAISYSAFGLQTHSPSHFDNNNISGGLSAILSRWIDGINRFNDIYIKEASSIRERIDYTDYLVNPEFSGPNAGIELLIYRFGQIAHAFEDFYAHSNWVELGRNGLLLAPNGTNFILDAGLGWPAQIKPGDFIAGTNVMVAQSGPDWRKILKKSGTGSYSGSKIDVYWNVDSTNPDDKNNSNVAVVSATTLDGRKVYGLASGATSGAIYMDKDNSVFLRDPAKTAWYQQEYFRGFSHGGVAGTIAGQWVSPLNKDKAKQPNHMLAKLYANRQTQNEWDRMGNLIYAFYGVTGLNKFANYAFDSQVARDAYVGTYSKPGGRTSNPSVALENPTIGANFLSTDVQFESPNDINVASVAEPIITTQKHIGLFTSFLGSSTSEGENIQFTIRDSSDDLSSSDYYIVIDGLSATFDQSDVYLEGGSLLSGLLLPESTRNLLSARAFIIDPKSDLEITLHLLDNDSKTEYFTTQLLHKISGELLDAPETYELLPTASVSDPLIRLVKLFGSDYFNASSPFNSGKYSYQYFDPTSRKWLDTDYIAFDIHSDIDSLVSNQITTPAKNQHGTKGERAVWRINSDTTIDRSGTNYFVELANNKTTVYIDDFDIHHDRIFLLDDSSNEIPLPNDLYAPTSASKLVDKLVNYNVALNFRPETFSRPNLFHVSSEQLASSLSLNANQFASDYLGKQLFFTAFDNSLPFLELKNGKLVATSIDAKYIGGTHTVYTSISNGTSILTNVPIHIALAPKLNINGDLFDNQSVFNLTITKLSDSSYTIYVQLEDVSNQGIGSFVEVASTTGSASGLATGFDSLNSKVFLGDEINSGKVKFWLKGTTDQLVPLTIVSNNTGSYRMLNQIGDEIAKFNYQGLNITPHGSSLVYGDSFYDGLGFDLNQSMNDIALKAPTDPWRVTISMDLYREAVINNQIGLYLFDKSSNGIVDPVSGMVIDHNLDFAKNIERYAVWTGSTDNGIAKQFSAEFNINSLVDIDTVAIAPFLKIPNNLSSSIYSSFDSLNYQGACVAKILSDNVIGFDDIHDGTQDLDYDDLIMRFITLRVV